MNGRYTVVVPFGPDGDAAVLIYDRPTGSCVVIASSLTHLPDAVATARTMKADRIFVIAPEGAEQVVHGLITGEEKLYVLRR